MLTLWAVSSTALAAIAAAATCSVVGILPVAVVNDARQIATVESNPTATVPVGFNGAGASFLTYQFYGLALFETSFSMFGVGGGGGNCFVAILTSEIPEGDNVQGGYSMSGPSCSGCRVNNFSATISILVDSASPPGLRAQFPDSALQFIEDRDRIGVFLGTRSDD